MGDGPKGGDMEVCKPPERYPLHSVGYLPGARQTRRAAVENSTPVAGSSSPGRSPAVLVNLATARHLAPCLSLCRLLFVLLYSRIQKRWPRLHIAKDQSFG